MCILRCNNPIVLSFDEEPDASRESAHLLFVFFFAWKSGGAGVDYYRIPRSFISTSSSFFIPESLENTVFVPVSNCSTEIDADFNADQSADDGCVFNGDDYIWYNIKAINALGLINPDVYGAPVREYFAQAETEMTAGMATLLKEACEIYETDPEAAISMITEYCCEMQKNAFADSKEVLASQLWTLSLNSNTMKKGVNPETHEALDTYRELTPVEIALKADKYGFAVPEKPKLL